MTEVYVARAEEFDGDLRRAVEHGPLEIVVLRHGDRFYAFENRCAHSGGPIAEGTVIGRVEAVLGPDMTCLGERFSADELHLVCPWHGWEYDLDSGQSFMGGAMAGVRSYGVGLERGGSLLEEAMARPAERVPGPYVAETFEVSVEDEYVVLHA
jgi:3-phenylpropionate/trans-cinnamate dioxygenase ferredoxin subunit